MMEFKQKNIKFLFIIFTFLIVLIYALSANFTQAKSYNILNKFILDKKIASDNISLIVVDDKSLFEIGRWPWKRELYLEIFNFLEEYSNVKLIGYDGLIVAPDKENQISDINFFKNCAKYKKLVIPFEFSKEEFKNKQTKEEYSKLLNSKTTFKITDKRSKKSKTQSEFNSFSNLQIAFFENIKHLGFINFFEDFDGYIRKNSPIINYKNKLYPSITLVMYQKFFDIDEFVINDKYLFTHKNGNILKMPITTKDGIVYNLISYYQTSKGGYSYKKYSASDIIKSYRALKAGKKPIIEPNAFNDKVVFVGANANVQELVDIARTPSSEIHSSLDIQATNFENLINNDFIIQATLFQNFLICFFVVILVFIFAITMPVMSAMLASICIMFLYFALCIFAIQNNIALNLILPEIFVFIAIGLAYSYRYLIEKNKKNKMQKAMGKYLSYDVMQNVVKNIDNIELGGKRADITVLFADIRNFTTISENMDASSVSKILNEYFSEIVPIIEEHNGLLNKFMGDAVLAIFGEPKKSKNHALDAVKCADKMLKKVKYLQEKWIDEGKPKIEMGIGISSGEAFIGNIGSKDRLEYTVIGDTVNTASRIENYNKVYKTNFLVSESTYNLVKNCVDVITIKNVLIRCKKGKINLYEVIRLVD